MLKKYFEGENIFMKKKIFEILFIGVLVCSLGVGCRKKNDDTSLKIEANRGERETESEIYENLGIEYTVNEDGTYLCKGRNYNYKITLTGRDNCATSDCRYVVLTDNEDITYEEVAYSLISSDIRDGLTDTVIIGIEALEN